MGRLIRYKGKVVIPAGGDLGQETDTEPGDVVELHPLLARALLADRETWEPLARREPEEDG